MGKIVIKNESGNRYELEFNRSALVRMEKNGFHIDKLDKEPVSSAILLMRGAFYMHQPTLTDDEIDKICDDISIDNDFIGAVANLYNEALLSLSGQDKKTTKNFKWEKI